MRSKQRSQFLRVENQSSGLTGSFDPASSGINMESRVVKLRQSVQYASWL